MKQATGQTSNKNTQASHANKKTVLLDGFYYQERVMGLEPTISCLGSKRSTTELHPRAVKNYTRILISNWHGAVRLPVLAIYSPIQIMLPPLHLWALLCEEHQGPCRSSDRLSLEYKADLPPPLIDLQAHLHPQG